MRAAAWRRRARVGSDRLRSPPPRTCAGVDRRVDGSGGRSYELNDFLASEVPCLVAPLFERLGESDRLALFTYADELRTVADFDTLAQGRRETMRDIRAPNFSQANFHFEPASVSTR
jgi:hypothetical protein